jgi:hypothetical protein
MVFKLKYSNKEEAITNLKKIYTSLPENPSVNYTLENATIFFKGAEYIEEEKQDGFFVYVNASQEVSFGKYLDNSKHQHSFS